MDDELLDSDAVPKHNRPLFLTVLCVLTFIGSGYGLVDALLGIIGASILDLFTSASGMIAKSLGLLAVSLCLFGAIQMWRLKKQGFWLYALGGFVSMSGVLIHVVSINSSMSRLNTKLETFDAYSSTTGDAVVSVATGFMWLTVFFSVVVNLGFILMYAANKKALVK